MRTRRLIATVLLPLALAACGTDEPERDTGPGPSEDATTDNTSTPSRQDDAAGDRTAQLVGAAGAAEWASNITAVTETEPGRFEIETNLVDPRGDSGSPEAQAAIRICEAAIALLNDEGIDDPFVAVLEEDGTHWILHGHPAYPEACSEV